MFRVSFTVEDRKLPDVLRTLADQSIYNLETLPVSVDMDISAVALNDAAPQVTPPKPEGKKRGGVVRLDLDDLPWPRKGTQISRQTLVEWVTKRGLSLGSVNYIAGRAEREGYLKKIDTALYEVK